ncbi:alginate lyase family protein [Caulobacter sp. NIBR2454]|uniref:alginate lyase family protein n=1 Tax=Caulobacter sp. NIBR2454 TaxID=3015996 RepID=UPI0022B6DD40|nr:alginate lyase family protein [Caulobacter sp. NIBR2454]
MRSTLIFAALLTTLTAAPALAAGGFAICAPATASSDKSAPELQRVLERAAANRGRAAGAIPKLHTEGTLPGHGIRDISIKAKADHPITLDFALAWRLTGERAYLDQTARYLKAWADIYEMSFNPIDETGFDALMLSYDLTKQDLPPALRARMDGFWRRMAVGYLDAMDAGPRNANTNWQSHRIKLATMSAFLTGDTALITRAREAYRAQVAANLNADGTTFDFHERDALHYVTYNFDPLLMAMLAAKANGQDWFSYQAPSGSSLPHSLDWFAAYARGDKTHIEFANSKIQFDRDRAAAGQSEYAPHPWKPGGSVNTFALAAVLDPKYAALSRELSSRYGRPGPAWLAVCLPRPAV